MFLLFIFLGMIIAVSSPHWFGVWIGLEINIYSFLPFISGIGSTPTSSLRQEAATKYFFSQAVGSIILLTSALAIYTDIHSIILAFFLIAILLKAGAAPFHFWYPRVIAILPWPTCWLLSTIQKLLPLFLLIKFYPFRPWVILIAGTIIVIVGGIGGLNQTQLRAIIAYSAIGQIGWLTASIQLSTEIAIVMFINYLVTIRGIILLFTVIESKTGDEPSLYRNRHPIIIVIIVILLISLAGIPVFVGFYPKLFLIKTLVCSGFYKTVTFLIIGSLLNLYYYLKIIQIIIFTSRRKITPEEFSISIASFYIIWSILIISSHLIVFYMIPWILP